MSPFPDRAQLTIAFGESPPLKLKRKRNNECKVRLFVVVQFCTYKFKEEPLSQPRAQLQNQNLKLGTLFKHSDEN